MAGDARTRSSTSSSRAEANKLAGTLDRLVFYFRKWYTQNWNADAPASGSLIGRYMMERLATSDKPWRMSDLATVLDTSGRMVTSLVDSYEAEGMVRRQAHPTDRRAILVELTASRSDARAPLRNYHQGAASLFEGVSDADREAFMRVAEHIIGHARASLTPPAEETS